MDAPLAAQSQSIHHAHTSEAGGQDALQLPETPLVTPYHLLDKASDLALQLNGSIESFWNVNPKVHLLSVAPDPHYYWHTQDFYVAQKGLDKEGRHWAQLRLSENLCQMLLEHSLGRSGTESAFNLDTVRHFEVFLLEQFSRKLFQLLYPALFLSVPVKRKRRFNELGVDIEPLMHLVWAVGGEPDQVNQIVLTGPQVCFKTQFDDVPPQPLLHVPDHIFDTASGLVTLQIGRSWARLEDLQQLDIDDVIVFEDSHVNHWQFIDPIASAQSFMFSVTLPPYIAMLPPLWPEQGTNAMSPMNQTVWDNLQVEVTAQFNPMRLSLKRLKELEKGLVLEMADLMENRLEVQVEGHSVAWGELIVVGDKFGVRIQGLHETIQPPVHHHTSSAPHTVDTGTHDAIADMATDFDNQMASAPMGDEFGEAMGPSNDLLDDLEMDETDFDDLDDEEDWS